MHKKSRNFYGISVYSQIQKIFKINQSISNKTNILPQKPMNESCFNEFPLNQSKSSLQKKSVINLSPNKSKKKKNTVLTIKNISENNKEPKSIYVNSLKKSKVLTKPEEKEFSTENKNLTTNHKTEKSEYSNKFSENKLSEPEKEEKTKTLWISHKTEGLNEINKYSQTLVLTTPLKNRKMEGVIGVENQILYEIKTNGLTSLKKELVDPSEESRNSIASITQSQDNFLRTNLLQKFLYNNEEDQTQDDNNNFL